MISASTQKRCPTSISGKSVVNNLWIITHFLWLTFSYIGLETIAALCIVNKRITDILFALNITNFYRIGSITNYLDELTWCKYFPKGGKYTTFTNLAYFKNLEEAHITEKVCNLFISNYGHKFEKLKTLKVLFERPPSDYEFQEKYRELYHVFACHDHVVSIEFVVQDKQSPGHLKSLSREYTEELINSKPISLKSYEVLDKYLRNGVDLTGFTQQEKDSGLRKSILAGEDTQASNWLWLGANHSLIVEEGKSVTMKAIESQMPHVIAHQLMHGEDPTLVPEMLRESVCKVFPHPDLKNIFFEEKSKWFPNVDCEECTSLHYAAKTGNMILAKILIEKGASIETKEKYGETPLHVASGGGNAKMVMLLLEKGADIEAMDKNGSTAFHHAVNYDNLNMVKLLFAKGSNIKAKDKTGCTVLHFAVHIEKTDMITFLLEKGVHINAKNKDDQTPLHIATCTEYVKDDGYSDIVQLLLERGADVEARDKDGRTVLHLAARENYANIAQLILEKGANVEARDTNGWTALHSAACSYRGDVIPLLIEKGANVEAKTNDGRTALHNAVGKDSENVVELLIKKRVNIEARDGVGRTALHIAADNKLTDMVELLLDSGARTEEKDKNGRTVLYISAFDKNYNLAKLLLERRAYTETRDDAGRTFFPYCNG